MIWRNFFRELFHTTSRLVSVIIITALAVLMSVGLSGIYTNGHRIVGGYFESQNIASYWITGYDFNARDIRKLRAVGGVEQIQPRVVIDAESRHDENVTLELFGIEGSYALNTPLILEGRFPEGPREMMLSDVFAQKNGLRLGDAFEMKLPSGAVYKKEICALIKAPECLNHYNATHLTPDLGAYGFAYMDADAMADVLGKNLYNQICVTTAPGIGGAAFKRAVSDALGAKALNILALEDNGAVYSLLEQIDSIELILRLFPLLFFFVAVLIMFSTMSRLVENARMSIGTFKALGYPDRKILFYYLNSSMLVVLLGFVLGSLPATGFLSKLILDALMHSMDMPPHALLPDTASLVTSFALTCLFCIGTALIVTVRALAEKPSECMRPKPPKKEKGVLLERTPIWRLLSFSQKYIVRNMMRNKTRMLICVVGITACMALSLCAFALNDSINHEVDLLMTNAYRFDMMIAFEDSPGRAQYEHIAKLPGVSAAEFEMYASVKIYSADKLETASLAVTEDVLRLKLLERGSAWPLVMPSDGVIMEEDLAEKLGLSAGGEAFLKFPDRSEYYPIRIADTRAAVEGIVAAKSYWRALGRGYAPTSAYVNTDDVAALAEKLKDFDFVDSHKSKSEMVGAIEDETSSLSLIVFVLIVFGGVLALVVLYNLGVMSFYEQIRSLATLRVLGFYDKETRKLLLSENIVFAALGILLGVPLGIELADIILTSLATFYFNLWVQALSYAAAAAITLGFALVVNLLLGAMMRKIDMLGALKSVE